MKHALLAAAMATLLATPVFAEDKATVATCGASGCTCRLTARTDAADAVGQAILRAAGLADCDVAVDFRLRPQRGLDPRLNPAGNPK